MAAVIHQSGVLGSAGPAKLEIIDASGHTVNRMLIETDPNAYVRDLHWAGEVVLVREWDGPRGARIKVVHPERGEVGRIGVPEGKGRSWTLHGPTTDGTVFIHRLVMEEPRRYELAPLDLERFRIGDPVLVEDDDLPTFARKRLSPSGRYWARGVHVPSEGVIVSHVLDLVTGQRADYPSSLVVGWLAEDRLVRLASELEGDGSRVVIDQGIEGEILSRSFPRGVGAIISPDLQQVLVSQHNIADRFYYPFYWGVSGSFLEHLSVCDGRSWTELDSLRAQLEGRDNVAINWGGPNTLIATDARSTVVAKAKPGAEWRGVIGSWD